MDFMENFLIKEYLKCFLVEDAYERHTGVQFNVNSHLKKYVSDEMTPSYYFTMTDINKVGINPQSEYHTPTGIYAYPLNTSHYKMLLSNNLPFVSSAPNCTILKLIEKNKTLKVGDANVTGIIMWHEIQPLLIEVAKFLNPGYDNKQIMHLLDRIEDKNDHYNKNPDAQFFGATFLLTKSPTRWSTVMRKFGFSAVYDPGYGIIHPSEPSQCVFLSPNSYRVIESFNTSSIRRNTSDQTAEEIKKLSLLLTTDSEIDSPHFTDSTVKKIIKLLGNFSQAKLMAVLKNKSLAKKNAWIYIKAFLLLDKNYITPELLENMPSASIATILGFLSTTFLAINDSNKNIIQWIVQKPMPKNIENAITDGLVEKYVWDRILEIAEEDFDIDINNNINIAKPKISPPKYNS